MKHTWEKENEASNKKNILFVVIFLFSIYQKGDIYPSYLHNQNKSVYIEKETTIERSVNGNLIHLLSKN